MGKKPVPGAESKTSKSKAGKLAAQTLHHKGQPLKQASHGTRRAQASGGKTKLPRTEGGIAVQAATSNQGLVKAVTKIKHLKPVQGNKIRAADLVDDSPRGDDVVSQMQLCERSERERQNGIEIPTASTDERLSMSSPPPNLVGNPNAPEVRTPFNKRLVSSTPDPERLLEIEESSAYAHPHCYDLIPPSSPQLVPERDLGAAEKPKLTLSGIGEFLKQQRENQLVWQQQLAQLQVTNSSSKPEGQNSSAFYQWLGMKSMVQSHLDPVPVIEPNISENPLPKAEWVEEAVATEQSSLSQNQTSSSDKLSDSHGHATQKSDDKPAPYTTFGASSAQQERWENVLQHDSDLRGATDTKELSVRKKGNLVNPLPSKSYSESAFYDKFASSKPKPSLKGNLNVKTLPRSETDSLRSQSSSVDSKFRQTLKTSERRSKGSVTANASNKIKKKKEKDSSVDERGHDVPPLEIVSQKEQPAVIDLDLRPSEEIKADDMNASLSTCSEEINILLSSDVSDQRTAHHSDAIPDVPYSKPPEGIGTKLMNQNTLSNNDKIAILDVLSDRDIGADTPEASGASISKETELITKTTSNFQNSPEESTSQLDQTENEKDGSNSNANQDPEVKFIPQPVGPETDESSELVTSNERSEPATKSVDNGTEKEENVNQNYNGEEMKPDLDLHYLDKMADPMLHSIACRLALKATTIRDRELRNLIDSMIFHTNAALADEDTRFHSSQMFFAEENNKLKKRIHTINKQLEAKERLERQADTYMGISNTDVMHLERKNLYLRQEKDRLDQQVTNLLEEKAKWLITQQDLVKTISLKDHEILKLEEKHQEDKKNLHKSLDVATQNSQGVHYKLSVADREISNLEQRMKLKERELCEMKDQLKGMERELSNSINNSRKKDEEMIGLQDLVDTLKVGVDEVLKAYETNNHGQGESEEQRRGISFLRQMVSEPSRSHHSHSHRDPSTSAMTRTTLEERHHDVGHKHHSHHSSRSAKEKGLPNVWTDEYLDSSLLPPDRIRDEKQPGTISNGSSLTLQAVEEHNRRYSPVDKILWHSLETQPVMPVIDGEEPYYSDSEIHIINNRGRRRRQLREMQSQDPDFFRHPSHQRSSSLSPRQHKDRTREERDFGSYRDKSHRSHMSERNGVGEQSMISRKGEISRRQDERILTSTKRLGHSGTAAEMGAGRGNLTFEDSDLISLPLQRETIMKETQDSRYQVADYFQEYSDKVRSYREQSDPVNSIHLQSVAQDERWGHGLDRSETIPKSYHMGPSRESERRQISTSETPFSSFQSLSIPDPSGGDDRIELMRTRDEGRQITTSETPLSSLQSMSIPDPSRRDDRTELMHTRNEGRQITTSETPCSSLQSMSIPDPSQRDDRIEFMRTRRAEQERDPSSKKFTLSLDGVHFQSLKDQERPGLSAKTSDPLSASCPVYYNSRNGKASQSSNGQSATLMSVSLPLSHQRKASQSSNGQSATLMSASLPLSHQRKASQSSNDQSPTLMSASLPLSPRRVRDTNIDTRQYEDSHQSSDSAREGRQRTDDSGRGGPRRSRAIYRSHDDPVHHSRFPPGKRTVTFLEQSVESQRTPSLSFHSDFLNSPPSFPPQSSPVNTSEISLSRRATRDSTSFQNDFFQGTELSASISSISDQDVGRDAFDNSNNNQTLDEESFSTGIASLDTKIARLQAKINHTKAVFS